MIKPLAMIAALAVGASPLAAETTEATGALLRGLDKLSGEVVDIDLDVGYSIRFGDLRIDLAQCRYPAGNPSGDAYAYVTVVPNKNPESVPVFQGWMIASAPALNAMDHDRFDVWVMRCKTP